MAKLPKTSEDELQEAIVDLAQTLGWTVYHALPAQTSKGWRTQMIGDPGFPDWVMTRHGDVIFAELKSTEGKLTVPQKKWLAELSGMQPEEWHEDMQVIIDAEEGRRVVVAAWGPKSWDDGMVERALGASRAA